MRITYLRGNDIAAEFVLAVVRWCVPDHAGAGVQRLANHRQGVFTMANDFIPTSDADALIWMQSFSSGISSSVATYQLSQSDADTIAAAVQAYADALAISSAPLTRTPGTVNAKDIARNSAESLCRQYAIQKCEAGVQDGAKIANSRGNVSSYATRAPTHDDRK